MRRSKCKSRGKSQDRALESLNDTPETTSKTSATTLGLMPQRNRAASAEIPESPPAKKPAPTGQTPPAKPAGCGVQVVPRCYVLRSSYQPKLQVRPGAGQ
ncbi:hypothetical protein MRX96_021741 [Rhipicephalus microplus]